jgi:DNA excision repair protein ERCC-3
MTEPGPLVVQSDRTLLLEVAHPEAELCRTAIAPFAELEKSPEHIHTFRVTSLSLWNARAAGFDAEQAVDALLRWSRYEVPNALLSDVVETMARYGRLVIDDGAGDDLELRAVFASDAVVLDEVLGSDKVNQLVSDRLGPQVVLVPRINRGRLKQALLKVGWPAEDLARYVEGTAHDVALRCDGWELRHYQAEAVRGFVAGGSGVVVLPCGAGKTIVGAAALAEIGARTLILVTSTVAARQWKRELLARTDLSDADIGEYSGERKEIRPVTIATYQLLISRRKGHYPHLSLLDAQNWGLVVYDEVHLLPAPVFRMTAELQSRRRLGLTATLVREDRREGDVFTLIGPKRYDAPWRDLEAQGWIAPATCTEVRVTLGEHERLAVAAADPDERYRVASTASAKDNVVEALVARHRGEPTLVIGQYIDQLQTLSARLGVPLITGKTATAERERLYDAFRSGHERLLVVSKVANFSIDLPDASVAIQVSGTFGSRQEEAQRLGRILRPKPGGGQASFYSVVARDTVDADMAAKRQRFLAEQGYAYALVDARDVLDAETGPSS